ncbi:MAG TPA: hypothetical protein VN767_28375 [Streptosporangiaceae bacterium]|jgi:hypothetical protein|nr:hypothetical protein [Streptosporangiaceae bacterium]
MTQGGMRRTLAVGLTFKLGIPLLLGLITIVSAHVSGMNSQDSLQLGALVIGVFLLAMFLIEFDLRLLNLGEGLDRGLTKLDQSIELAGLVERSALGTELLTEFIDVAGKTDENVNPLLLRMAQREIKRVTHFVQELPGGREIAYDGEDREWLLGLTQDTERSVDAISLSTVDAGMRGFDGGLWTSDLGTRYLELQREAVARGIVIRRIFVFESNDLVGDETFLNITKIQRDVGVDVRMLDHQLIPEWIRSMIFDFIIFDGAVSYETTPATTFNAGTRPAIVRTLLAPMADRLDELQSRFEQLWEAADPERQL